MVVFGYPDNQSSWTGGAVMDDSLSQGESSDEYTIKDAPIAAGDLEAVLSRPYGRYIASVMHPLRGKGMLWIALKVKFKRPGTVSS